MKKYIKSNKYNVIEQSHFDIGGYNFWITEIFKNDEVIKISTLQETPYNVRRYPYYYFATSDKGINTVEIKNSNTGELADTLTFSKDVEYEDILTEVCNRIIELDEEIQID